MATVFLAEDLNHPRSVATKVLDPEVAEAIGPEWFVREIETVANLNHVRCRRTRRKRCGGVVGYRVMNLRRVALASSLVGGVTLAAWPVAAAQVPVGPRAIALGGAYSSVANDASAIFWNPAGLVRIDSQEIEFTYANLYGTGIKDFFGAYVLPLTRRHIFGLDVYHSGFDDGELLFGESRFDAAYAFGYDRLSGGATVKYVRRETGLDGSTIRDGGGFGFDLGILARPWREWSIGLVGQDLFDTRISYAKSGTSTQIDQNLRFSTSYAYRKWGLLALDIDDQVHGGIEVRPLEAIALRAGFRKDREGGADPIYAFGTGFQVGVVRLDYTYELHPVLDATSHFGLSIEYNLNPAQIQIENVDASPVYASLYQSYGVTPIATASIKNLKDEALPVRVGVRVAGLMQTFSSKDTILRPGVTTRVPLTAVLPEAVLDLTGDRRAEVEVQAEYQSLRVTRTDRNVGRCDVFGPGAINWRRGVDQAAAFVTSADPTIKRFATEAARDGDGAWAHAYRTRRIARAAAIVDALATLDLAYVEDPISPYKDISQREAVDTIHYPRETLRRLAGDCDDTSVLVAALLGSVGIPTRFVDVPGHLFVMFDTGLQARHQVDLDVPDTLLVTSDDRVWIPLETVALRDGFMEAWSRGALECRTWQANGKLRLVDVQEAQTRYAAAVASHVPEPSLQLDGVRIRERLKSDAAAIESLRKTSEVLPDLDRLTLKARKLYVAGRLEESRAILLQVLRVHEASARLHNNLGVVDLALHEPAKAIEQFRRALELEPGDTGMLLNLGMAQHAKQDVPQAMETLRRAIRQAGGYERALALLGLPPPMGGSPPVTDLDEAARRLVEGSLSGVAQTAGKGAPAGPQALYWHE